MVDRRQGPANSANSNSAEFVVGALCEKAENAVSRIEKAATRLIQDGLMEHCFYDDLETLKRVVIELEQALRKEWVRRRSDET